MASNPPQSHRQRILDSLVAQLKTITVANGYAQTVVDVTQNVKNWNELEEHQTPIIYVIDEKTHYTYGPGRLNQRDWTVALFGVLKNADQADAEELITDIEVCLLANMTLAYGAGVKTIAHLRILDIVTDRQLFSEVDRSALFKVTLELKYTVNLDNVR